MSSNECMERTVVVDYKNKIVHIIILDKFIPPFIDFINEHFDANEHLFVILGKERYKFGLTKEHDVVWIDSIFKLFSLAVGLNSSRKIIIHGLWSQVFNMILFVQPWLLQKSYWVMWGGDFYFPKKQSWIKRQVIKNMKHFITYLKGDYELVQQWYGAKGKYHECFMYPSNLFKEYDIKERENNGINIQVGNSADPTNNHLKILEKLFQYKEEDIRIYVPLSYGDQDYANAVVKKGKELFGDKFIPMTEFIPFEKYLEFLGEVRIAVFAHDRQQAMGNIITLLGLGKKVYLNSNTVQWNFFTKHQIEVYDVNEITLKQLDILSEHKNKKKIQQLFSTETLVLGLKEIFNA